MRISDWSSDGCSSDLIAGAPAVGDRAQAPRLGPQHCFGGIDIAQIGDARIDQARGRGEDLDDRLVHQPGDQIEIVDREILEQRSEEHTSELQSLMRISYAVFCLKKKITPTYIQTKSYQ